MGVKNTYNKRGAMIRRYKYIHFSGDNGYWFCFANRDGAMLGHVEWFRRWGQYCFFPRGDTVHNVECLGHIADFLGFVNTMVGQPVYLSRGNIPEVFLRGAGVPDSFIENMASLVGKPIEFYSCFISYSSKDQMFAERLHNDLQGEGVRCWFAPEDMRIGDRIRPTIDQAIRSYDKLLIVLSEHSIDSDWVEKEVEAAFEEERKREKTMLFPIRLDSAVMETDQAWAADIRRIRHIGDFTHWKDHEAYQKAFERLLRDLKAEEEAEATT